MMKKARKKLPRQVNDMLVEKGVSKTLDRILKTPEIRKATAKEKKQIEKDLGQSMVNIGWWKQNADGHSDLFSPAEKAKLRWGDAVADVMDSALVEILKIYKKRWGRLPTYEEVVAGCRFSAKLLERKDLKIVFGVKR